MLYKLIIYNLNTKNGVISDDGGKFGRFAQTGKLYPVSRYNILLCANKRKVRKQFVGMLLLML